MIGTASRAPRKEQIPLKGGESCSRTAFREHDRDCLCGVLVGRLGALLRASWAVSEPSCGKPAWALFVPARAPLGAFGGASSGLLRASWGPLGGLLGPPGGLLGRRARFFGSSSLSWAPLGGLLGAIVSPLGRLLGRLEALLGRLGALLGPSGAILEQFWEPLGRSWSVGKPKKREGRKHRKTNENQRFWPLGALLGGLLGRVGGLMEPSWGVLGATWQFLRLSMRVLERSRGVLGGLQPILAVSGALREPSDPPRTPGREVGN